MGRGGFQPGLFDRTDAETAKLAGMDKAYRHAPEEWKREFMKAIETTARRLEVFTADAIWIEFQATYDKWRTAHPRAAGPMIIKAMRSKIIVPIENMYRNSTRASCHGRPIQVYRSLIYHVRFLRVAVGDTGS
jgi:hypothetical protein